MGLLTGKTEAWELQNVAKESPETNAQLTTLLVGFN